MTKIKTATIEIASNGLKVFYRKFGSGPPLILFHGGWASGDLNWSMYFDDFSEKFTVYVPDHRGHGRTNNPDNKFTSYGQLAWDMIEFIRELKLDTKPVIMGHSSGALISLHISIYQPEMIARQVLIGIHPYLGDSEHWKQGTEKFFCTESHRRPPAKWRYTLAHPFKSLVLWSVHKSTPWFQLLLQAWPMWSCPLDLDDSDYAKVSCPTLVLMGTRDEFGSIEEANDLMQRIKGACLMIVPDANHLFVMEQPKRLLKRVLPFLCHGPSNAID